MRLRVQVVIEPDGDGPNGDRQSTVVHDVASIERDELTVDTLGLQLAEAKLLLQRVKEVLIDEQVRSCLSQQLTCPSCGRLRATRTTSRS
jgi:hypothetical protein